MFSLAALFAIACIYLDKPISSHPVGPSRLILGTQGGGRGNFGRDGHVLQQTQGLFWGSCEALHGFSYEFLHEVLTRRCKFLHSD